MIDFYEVVCSSCGTQTCKTWGSGVAFLMVCKDTVTVHSVFFAITEYAVSLLPCLFLTASTNTWHWVLIDYYDQIHDVLNQLRIYNPEVGEGAPVRLKIWDNFLLILVVVCFSCNDFAVVRTQWLKVIYRPMIRTHDPRQHRIFPNLHMLSDDAMEFSSDQ